VLYRTNSVVRTVIALALLTVNVCAYSCPAPAVGKPVAVTSPAAAIAAAKEAWKSIFSKAPQHSEYSAENVAKAEPYVAKLENGVWHVFGTLPEGLRGGTPEASVCEVDGSVSATWHSR
jgi:hypothetical protein